MSDEIKYSDINKSFEAAVERSKKIEADLNVNPKKYRVLTGDRPTGNLHIGHYFGSLQNRVRLAKMGVPTMILIADYQVLTDHDAFDKISQNTKQLVIDYLAAGLDPETMKIKKPKNYVPDKEKKEASEKKKKPARTFVEGNGGDPDENDDAEIEYEDGISLEMPEWLKRLGFPVSEWLKYKGSLESGLPDSALEHVAPEYRNLVREYFKLLSKEK